jgi:putative DNA primase/helicase
VTAATDDYLVEQDLFGQWLEEECDVDVRNMSKWEHTTDLFASWSAYARLPRRTWYSEEFCTRPEAQGLQPYRTKNSPGLERHSFAPDKTDTR